MDVKMNGEMLLNLGLSVYHPKRITDWDRGRKAERKGCGQARKRCFGMIGEVCV